MKLFFSLILFSLLPSLVFSSCKTPDWSQWKFPKNIETDRKKMFQDYLHNSKILLKGKIIRAEKSIDGKKYHFSVLPLTLIKGSYKGRELKFEYKYNSQSSEIVAPTLNSIWIFSIQKIKGDRATIKSAKCGDLGFPVTSLSLMAELDNFLMMQPASMLNKSCADDGECREVSCDKLNNEIKSGYRVGCVKYTCQCQCYGCK